MRRDALYLALLVGPVACGFEPGGQGSPFVEDAARAEVDGVADTGPVDPVDTSVDAGADTVDEGTLDPTWTEKAWAYRRRIDVDGSSLKGDLDGFVVPVVLTDPGLAGKVSSDGRDLRFVAPDGLALPFELARWEPSSGNLMAWVRLPKTGPTQPNTFFLYYGNADATSSASPAKTWESETAVWHFDEVTTEGGTTARLVDASTLGHDGTQNGSATAPGVILGGQRFDGKDVVEVDRPDEIVLGDVDCTFAVWIRTTEGRQQGILIKAKGETHEVGDKLIGTGHEGPYFGTDHGWVGFTRTDVAVQDGKWHHVAWVQRKDDKGKAESWKLYVDGVEKGSGQQETRPDVAGHTVRIGAKANGSYFDNPWSGDLDELRYAKVARAPAWIAALERSQRDPVAFSKVGPEVAR